MVDEGCPFCGVKLKEGNGGELFCPNHDIIKSGRGSESEGTPSYCG